MRSRIYSLHRAIRLKIGRQKELIRAQSEKKNRHRPNADACCPKYAQIRVIRGDYRFTTFRTATTLPSATALTR